MFGKKTLFSIKIRGKTFVFTFEHIYKRRFAFYYLIDIYGVIVSFEAKAQKIDTRKS